MIFFDNLRIKIIINLILEPPKKVVKKKRKDIPAEEKKICLWVLEDGTACGKTFTKFDSLKRHVSEAHKGNQQTQLES